MTGAINLPVTDEAERRADDATERLFGDWQEAWPSDFSRFIARSAWARSGIRDAIARAIMDERARCVHLARAAEYDCCADLILSDKPDPVA